MLRFKPIVLRSLSSSCPGPAQQTPTSNLDPSAEQRGRDDPRSRRRGPALRVIPRAVPAVALLHLRHRAKRRPSARKMSRRCLGGLISLLAQNLPRIRNGELHGRTDGRQPRRAPLAKGFPRSHRVKDGGRNLTSSHPTARRGQHRLQPAEDAARRRRHLHPGPHPARRGGDPTTFPREYGDRQCAMRQHDRRRLTSVDASTHYMRGAPSGR